MLLTKPLRVSTEIWVFSNEHRLLNNLSVGAFDASNQKQNSTILLMFPWGMFVVVKCANISTQFSILNGKTEINLDYKYYWKTGLFGTLI